MKRKMLIFLFGVTILLVILWFLFQKRQESLASVEYYSSILVQAPCIENVCPGFIDRELALENLSSSNIVKAQNQGKANIALWFENWKTDKSEGSGSIYFSSDSETDALFARRISYFFFDSDLGTVIKTLGEPDEYFFVSGCGVGNRVHASLFYLNRGVQVVIDYPTRRPKDEMLSNSTQVFWFEYYLPENYFEHIIESLNWHILDTTTYDLDAQISPEDFIAEIQPWPGVEAAGTPTADFCPR